MLSLAANTQQKSNLAEARRRLSAFMDNLTFTDELWTEPIGKARHPWPYLNQLAQGTTELPADILVARLKEVETDMGRTTEARQQGIVCIDLDLLLYDNRRYHERDWQRDYVRLLLTRFPRREDVF